MLYGVEWCMLCISGFLTSSLLYLLIFIFSLCFFLSLSSTAVMKAVDDGEDVNEVEAAGNTPLHCAAYEGWAEGCDLLLSLGAKVNASNNAGDRPWHWARNMGHSDVMELLEKVCFLVGVNAFWLIFLIIWNII